MTRPAEKILALEEVSARAKAARASGETVVLCHGCFDIVHPGHVRHLQHAARLGDRLLVTITGDALVEKGTGRPLIPQELRAENLAALDCVHWVTVNPHPTAVELLEAIRPDVFVKGREYETNRDPRFAAEKAVVEKHGGRVVYSSGDVVFSSTALIAALEQSGEPVNRRLGQLMESQGVDGDRLAALIDSFRGKRVLVVGETIIDTYVMCDRPELSSEAPVMTLRPLERRSFDGGAAIIARHVAAMGGRPVLMTALPPVLRAAELRERLESEGVQVRIFHCEGALLEKERYLVGTSKVMRLELGDPVVLDASAQDSLVGEAAAAEYDAAILADFGRGLLTAALASRLCRALRPRTGILAGDVSGRRSNLMAMRTMDLLCPAEEELREALRNFDSGLSAAAWELLHRTRSRGAIVTLGAEGAIAFAAPRGASLARHDWQTRLAAEHVPALAPYALDPLGCGDALLAAATLALTAGAALPIAALLGTVAAAAQSQRLGNAVIGAADLRSGVRRLAQRSLRAIPGTGAGAGAEVETVSGDQLRAAHA